MHKQLKRAGFENVVLGQFDTKYSEEDKLWFHHFHLIVPNDRKALKKLRMIMKSEGNMQLWEDKKHKPMMDKKIKNIIVQSAYLYVSYWPYVPKHKKLDVFKYERRRLPFKQHILSLYKLDEYGFSGIEFNYGIRKYRDKAFHTCPLRKY